MDFLSAGVDGHPLIDGWLCSTIAQTRNKARDGCMLSEFFTLARPQALFDTCLYQAVPTAGHPCKMVPHKRCRLGKCGLHCASPCFALGVLCPTHCPTMMYVLGKKERVDKSRGGSLEYLRRTHVRKNVPPMVYHDYLEASGVFFQLSSVVYCLEGTHRDSSTAAWLLTPASAQSGRVTIHKRRLTVVTMWHDCTPSEILGYAEKEYQSALASVFGFKCEHCDLSFCPCVMFIIQKMETIETTRRENAQQPPWARGDHVWPVSSEVALLPIVARPRQPDRSVDVFQVPGPWESQCLFFVRARSKYGHHDEFARVSKLRGKWRCSKAIFR